MGPLSVFCPWSAGFGRWARVRARNLYLTLSLSGGFVPAGGSAAALAVVAGAAAEGCSCVSVRLRRLHAGVDQGLQGLLQYPRGLALALHAHVGVDVHRDGAAGMSRQLLHHRGVDALAGERGEVGVPELVQGEADGAEVLPVALPPLLEDVGVDAGAGLGDDDGVAGRGGEAARVLLPKGV